MSLVDKLAFIKTKMKKTGIYSFFDDELPEGKITIEDFIKNKNMWAQRGFKQFVSENGVGGVVTDNKPLAKLYKINFEGVIFT